MSNRVVPPSTRVSANLRLTAPAPSLVRAPPKNMLPRAANELRAQTLTSVTITSMSISRRPPLVRMSLPLLRPSPNPTQTRALSVRHFSLKDSPRIFPRTISLVSSKIGVPTTQTTPITPNIRLRPVPSVNTPLTS